MEQRSTVCTCCQWSCYRFPSSLQHLDQTELCSLSQQGLGCDIMKRKRIAWLKKHLKARSSCSAHACTQHPPWLCDSLCPCRSDQAEVEKGRVDGWLRCRHTDLSFCGYFCKGPWNCFGRERPLRSSSATIWRHKLSVFMFFVGFYNVQSRVKQREGLMVIRELRCCAQQPDSSWLVVDSTKQTMFSLNVAMG